MENVIIKFFSVKNFKHIYAKKCAADTKKHIAVSAI